MADTLVQAVTNAATDDDALTRDIAQRAIESYEADQRRGDALDALGEAYRAWKGAKGIVERVPHNSPQYDEMMLATRREFGVLQAAKRDVRNAKQRMVTAIRRHRKAVR